tara:strand:+ start:572 stop:1672 length:1101 start_codon:yes stop_codon:yes gene_type:complete
MDKKVTIVIPTYNESGNIESLLLNLVSLLKEFDLDLLVIDDDSPDGTSDLVKSLTHKYKCIRLINRIGRSGLASAIKEGILNAQGEIVVVIDGDGQHDISSIPEILIELVNTRIDLIVASRFQKTSNLTGLSNQREVGSTIANSISRFSLSNSYVHLSDYMSGFFALKIDSIKPFLRKIDVNGFKFLYELLSISNGKLIVEEVPLNFNKRIYGSSKLDISIFWDFFVSVLHSISFRLIPRRAVSFGLVGATGVLIQLFITSLLMNIFEFKFSFALPISVITSATSNYLINNALTFRFQRLHGINLLKGLLKFLLVASLPVFANVGLATAFYAYVSSNAVWAQLAGVLLVFVWNYAASSSFVWNSPK